MPAVFPWLAHTGGIASTEMLRVFNCGIGMTLIVSDAAAATEILVREGEAPFLLGHVADRPGIVIADEARLFA
jgi:phosphoribosylformylglycinamidine cyclo-ligase